MINLITKETQFMQIWKSINLPYIPSTVPQCLSMYIIRMILHNQIDSWRDFFYIFISLDFSPTNHRRIQRMKRHTPKFSQSVRVETLLQSLWRRWRFCLPIIKDGGYSALLVVYVYFFESVVSGDKLIDSLTGSFVNIQVCDGIYDS